MFVEHGLYHVDISSSSTLPSSCLVHQVRPEVPCRSSCDSKVSTSMTRSEELPGLTTCCSRFPLRLHIQSPMLFSLHALRLLILVASRSRPFRCFASLGAGVLHGKYQPRICTIMSPCLCVSITGLVMAVNYLDAPSGQLSC